MNNRDKFLKSQKVLRLATIGDKKKLHIVPVWYLYSSKKIFIGTNTKTQKAKNAKKNKRVSFCVDVGDKLTGYLWCNGTRKCKNYFRKFQSKTNRKKNSS